MRRRGTTMTMDVTVPGERRVPYLFRVYPLRAGDPPVPIGLEGDTVLGREPTGPRSVTLDDPMVSRNHAVLRPGVDGACEVEDLGSKNGVLLNGTPTTRGDLADGDVLRVGNHVFVFRPLSLDVPALRPPRDGFVAYAPSMRCVLEACRRAGAAGQPVLLAGETGTGKEVLARRVHEASGRGGFVPVNCAAISPGLFESAVFGHRKGAFTGAAGDFDGFAGAADGGTLFLDEVGEIPVETQAKLLRFLESGELSVVGESRPRRVDVRLVSATNRDLPAAVRDRSFRSDLLARLACIVVAVPPLRQRPEDALAIAAARLSGAGLALSADAAEALAIHDWPFNVRGLLAAVENLKMACEAGATVGVAALPAEVRATVQARRDQAQPAAGATADLPGRDEVAALLAECDGNVSEVARRLARDRRQVYRWIERWGLR